MGVVFVPTPMGYRTRAPNPVDASSREVPSDSTCVLRRINGTPAGTTSMSTHDELERFAADGVDHARSFSADYQHLWTALQRATRSGKRLRSNLLMAAYRAHGGQDEAVASRVAAAVELLHTAFVIHDDVIDKDLRRRGSPNVSGSFVARAARRGVDAEGRATAGLAAGVLAGDLALVGALREVALCGADPQTTRQLIDQLTEAVQVSAAGELDDVAMSLYPTDDTSLGDVITMEERKTAVYSFQLPLQAGAVLAGAPTDSVETLGTVGRLAGIGFQLVDDLRGVFADEGVTGKSALGDLREGKLTPLIAHARGTEAWAELSAYVGDPDLDAEGAATARRILEACGSRGFVEELANSYLAAALAAADQTTLTPLLLTELTDLCQRILQSAA